MIELRRAGARIVIRRASHGLMTFAVIAVAILLSAQQAVGAHPGTVGRGSPVQGEVPGIGRVKERINETLYRIQNPNAPDTLIHTGDRPDLPSVAGYQTAGQVGWPTFRRTPLCGSRDRNHTVELVVTYGPGGLSRPFTELAGEARSELQKIGWKIDKAMEWTSGGTQGGRLMVSCSGGTTVTVQGPIYVPDANFGTISSTVKQHLGTPNQTANGFARKYLVFHDGNSPTGACYGEGYFDSPERLPTNPNRVYTTLAALYNGCRQNHISLHELLHTLGAVQRSAPHATQGAHVYKANDVMGYNDGTASGGIWPWGACPDYGSTPPTPANSTTWSFSGPSGFPVDCQGHRYEDENLSDYFDAQKNTTEKALGYNRWNVAGPENPFIVRTPPAGDTYYP